MSFDRDNQTIISSFDIKSKCKRPNIYMNISKISSLVLDL